MGAPKEVYRVVVTGLPSKPSWFRWPSTARLYIARHAANRRAEELRAYGATVHVEVASVEWRKDNA